MHGFTLISILFLVLIPSTVLAVALDVDDRSELRSGWSEDHDFVNNS